MAGRSDPNSGVAKRAISGKVCRRRHRRSDRTWRGHALWLGDLAGDACCFASCGALGFRKQSLPLTSFCRGGPARFRAHKPFVSKPLACASVLWRLSSPGFCFLSASSFLHLITRPLTTDNALSSSDGHTSLRLSPAAATIGQPENQKQDYGPDGRSNNRRNDPRSKVDA